VRVLIDTQCWLWMHLSPERFSTRTRRLVSRLDTDIVLSTVSVWEIAIKSALGKLRLPEPAEAWVPARMTLSVVTPLPVDVAHALRVGTLPPHHRDPFDRMLISQSLVEGLPVLTSDPVFSRYGVKVIAA